MKQTKRSLPTTSIYLDKSHPNKDGLFPLKIRVTFRRKSRYFKTKHYLSLDQYEKSYEAVRPKGNNKVLREKLRDLESKSEEIINSLVTFTFQEWEKQFYRKNHDNDGLVYHFEEKISTLISEERYSTAESYRDSKNKLLEFFKTKKNRNPSLLDININSLKEFENWMIKQKHSITTVGIYLRNCRHIFNNAIKSNDVPVELYPFGEGEDKYSIPLGNNIKKALSFEEVKNIQNLDLSNFPWLKKSRDFWLLSFLMNGINMNDLLRVRKSAVNGNKMIFNRRKTRRSKKVKRPTEIALLPLTRELMSTYECSSDEYYFDILVGTNSEQEIRKRVKTFTGYVDKHMKDIAKMAHVHKPISLIWARHSWATIALNRDAGIEFISSGLSHSSIATTEAYLKGFDSNVILKKTHQIFEGI